MHTVSAIAASYPGCGRFSICSFDIILGAHYNQPGNPVMDLINELDITYYLRGQINDPPVPQKLSETTVRIPLRAGCWYMEGISIRPKDSKSTLKKTIDKVLGKGRKVVVMPRTCEQFLNMPQN